MPVESGTACQDACGNLHATGDSVGTTVGQGPAGTSKVGINTAVTNKITASKVGGESSKGGDSLSKVVGEQPKVADGASKVDDAARLQARKTVTFALDRDDDVDVGQGTTGGTTESCDDDTVLNRAALNALQREFADVGVPLKDVPPSRGVAHTIPTEPGATPPYRRGNTRWSRPEQEQVTSTVKALLDLGYIEPCSSPYNAPILFIQKKLGGLRMCHDFRALNKITVRDRYPLPRIDSLLDHMAGCTVFSSLDMQQAYHQVQIP